MVRSNHSAFVLVTAFLLNGCAGVFNPYVHADNEIVIAGEGAARIEKTKLENAIAYAERQKSKYREAYRNQGYITPLAGAALIPLGATALGIASLGSSNTTASILGLTGAGLFGTANWLENSGAAGAYIAGFETVNCAIDAVTPFRNAIDDDSRLAQFEEGRNELRDALPELADAIAFAKSQQVDAALVNAAETVETKAKNALTSADAVNLAITEAGYRLKSTVDRITAEVDRGVLNNRVQLASLAGLVGNLGTFYGNFSPVDLNDPSGEKKAQEGADAATEGAKTAKNFGDSPEDQLQIAQSRVEKAGSKIAALVNYLSNSQPVELLGNCNVDPAAFALAMSVDPAGPVQLKPGEEKKVEVKGGKPFYSAQVKPFDGKLDVMPDGFFGSTFTIKADENAAKDQEYNIGFKDTARGAVELKVKIAGTAAGGGSKPGNNGQAKSHRVQLASKDTEQEANTEKDRLNILLGDKLNGRELGVKQTQNGKYMIFVVGEFSKEEGNKICTELGRSGDECLVAANG